MIPGLGNMSQALKDLDLDNSDEIKSIKAMISSMTPREREEPDLLNNSRKQRSAKGCGLEVMEINRMIKQFKNASKMAKKFSTKSGMKDLQAMMGGMGQMGGGGFPR
jgi:signal recognition particle subunit SRP54